MCTQGEGDLIGHVTSKVSTHSLRCTAAYSNVCSHLWIFLFWNMLFMHVELKELSPQHPKSTFEECFPDQVKFVAVPNKAVVYKGRSVAYAALGSDSKKGYPKDSGAVEFSSKEEAIAHIMAEVRHSLHPLSAAA